MYLSFREGDWKYCAKEMLKCFLSGNERNYPFDICLFVAGQFVWKLNSPWKVADIKDGCIRNAVSVSENHEKCKKTPKPACHIPCKCRHEIEC